MASEERSTDGDHRLQLFGSPWLLLRHSVVESRGELGVDYGYLQPGLGSPRAASITGSLGICRRFRGDSKVTPGASWVSS